MVIVYHILNQYSYYNAYEFTVVKVAVSWSSYAIN